jgi:hypothetical protein
MKSFSPYVNRLASLVAQPPSNVGADWHRRVAAALDGEAILHFFMKNAKAIEIGFDAEAGNLPGDSFKIIDIDCPFN